MDLATRVESQDRTLMFYKLTSKNAFSINLIFDKFILAPNASLLIYNTDRSMVYGPIGKDNNPGNGIFWSDLVKGESIILQLTIMGEDIKETQIHINKVIHGYRNTFAGFRQSADCNRDIACPEGNDWRNEGNAVAMVLLADGTRWCSGSLLNNVCQNLQPNFLTAFHCLDANRNGVLVDAEMNQVNNWVFRFLYESPSCGGGDDAVFQSINGSTFRAAFQPTDFALLLLNNRPTGDITYAGWLRANVAATSAVALHHPAGDVKKISIDNNPLTNIGITTTWEWDGNGNPLVQSPPNTHWNTVFDSPEIGIDPSTVQHGSSGSPIFDQNHRIVGQLHGDHLYTGGNTFCDNVRGDYGRFDVSWNGGGTTQTRLRDWLDPNNTAAMTTNTISIPFITGTELLCSTNTFSLQNPPPGSTVTWSATPTQLFSANTRSGTGSNAIVSPFHTNSRGQGTITFTIASACGPISSSRSFWVGKPATPGPISGNTTPGPGSYTPYYINNFPQGASSIAWGLPYCVGCSQPWSFVSGQNDILITAQVGDSDGYVQAMGSNACGNGGASFLYVTTSGPCDPCPRLYPNPVSDLMTIDWVDDDGLVVGDKIDSYKVSLYNAVGAVIISETNNNPSIQLDLSRLKNGFYFLHIEGKDGLIRKQVRVER